MDTTEMAEMLKIVATMRPSQTMNFNAPVGQQIAHVDRIEAHFDRDMGMSLAQTEATTDDGQNDIPECLQTERACRLKQKLVEEKVVDHEWQPLLSRTLSAIVADAVATELDIHERWLTFEKLWGRSGVRADFNRALSQKQSLDFQQRLKKIFADYQRV